MAKCNEIIVKMMMMNIKAAMQIQKKIACFPTYNTHHMHCGHHYHLHNKN